MEDIKNFDPKFHGKYTNNSNSLGEDLISTSQPVPVNLRRCLVDYAQNAVFGGAFKHELSEQEIKMWDKQNRLDHSRTYYVISTFRD